MTTLSTERASVLNLLPAELTGHLPTIVDEMTATVLHEVDLLNSDEVIAIGLRASIEANISMLAHLMQNPSDLRRIEAPSDAVDWAGQLAQRGIPFSTVLRAYSLCTARFFATCMRELEGLELDPTTAIKDVGQLSSLIHTYVDHICEQISKSYDAERARWLRQQDVARDEIVRAVLDGTYTGDDHDIEVALSYPIRGRHLSVVMWRSSAGRDDNQLLRMQGLVVTLAEELGCFGAPLLVPQDNACIWAWLPLPAGAVDWSAIVERTVASAPTIYAAVSETLTGRDGFVRAHEQAVIARSVGQLAHCNERRIALYAEVASVSFLCLDMGRTKSWVADVLGRLAEDNEHNARLRETLEVFLDCNASYASAAKTLHCHKNTVQYRIKRAEGLRGRSFRDGRLDLELALAACKWLAPVVLSLDESTSGDVPR